MRASLLGVKNVSILEIWLLSVRLEILEINDPPVGGRVHWSNII